MLDPDTTLIEYFVTQSNTFVWVVEKNQLHHHTIEVKREKLRALVKDFRYKISSLEKIEKINAVSRQLHRLLIQPVLPHVSGQQLVIVPHYVLHYLPFHALVSPNGGYLIEDYPIRYLSSASLMKFTRAKWRPRRGEKVLALGNPDLSGSKVVLKFAELEVQEIERLYRQSAVLLGKKATEEKIKKLSSQYDILHIAAHAELREDDPVKSALLLARNGEEDGRLEVREIFGMDLIADLVVLSGCETRLGKLSAGDELVGLTRSFIYAGTPSVVASLWKVEDNSTAALMGSFYRNLKTMSKAEALRQAQVKLLHGKARLPLVAMRGVGGVTKGVDTPFDATLPQISVPVSTAHPYFWAPFVLVGDGK